MKWIVNRRMDKLLNSVRSSENSAEELIVNSKNLKNLFLPAFKKVRDCILISNKSIDVLLNSFENAIDMYGDRTGYELSNTETRVNDYFDNNLSLKAGTRIALLIIELWSLQLKGIDSTAQFCFVLSCNDERVEIRFHKIRENEPAMIDEDIESYDDAIGFICI